LPFLFQHDEEDQRRDQRDRRMKKARHSRYDHKYNSLRGDVVKPVLVPARQFPPAVIKWPTLRVPLVFNSLHMQPLSRSLCPMRRTVPACAQQGTAPRRKTALVLKLDAVHVCLKNMELPTGGV